MFEKFGLIKNVIGAVAPTLGTALGGPMGGMAANMISEVLGCGNEPKLTTSNSRATYLDKKNRKRV